MDVESRYSEIESREQEQNNFFFTTHEQNTENKPGEKRKPRVSIGGKEHKENKRSAPSKPTTKEKLRADVGVRCNLDILTDHFIIIKQKIVDYVTVCRTLHLILA